MPEVKLPQRITQMFHLPTIDRIEPLQALLQYCSCCRTRSSAHVDNGLDAFSGQSRSTNIVPFHMLHIVSYCAIVTLSFYDIRLQKCRDLEMGVKGRSRSLRAVSFDRWCMVSY